MHKHVAGSVKPQLAMAYQQMALRWGAGWRAWQGAEVETVSPSPKGPARSYSTPGS